MSSAHTKDHLQQAGEIMTHMFDIAIRRARLRGAAHGQYAEIGIKDGRISAIAPRLDGAGAAEIDARGYLVTESFVNPHLHLCKVWTLPMMEEEALRAYQGEGMGKALSGIELASNVKEKYAESWIVENARRAVALAALHGNLHIRAFADVDGKARLEGVKALIRVRGEFRGIVDLQVVAFAQDGIVREPGAAELLHEAMALGADVVGGIPWIELTGDDAAAHIRTCFDLAAKFNKDVSMLLDDAGDPDLRTLEMMAVEAIKRGWQGRALAHHCRAMSLYPAPYVQRLARLLKAAGVAVVTDPHTGPLHARVKELRAEGVRVCLGQDDISDAYYAFGRNNMLEVAFLAAHLLWMMTRQDVAALYDMITIEPARAINLRGYGLSVGAAANLVLLDQPDEVEALRYHGPPAHVISHGRPLDAAKMQAIVAAGAPLA
jgi:cytosine/creatinine deaminase